MLEIVNYNEGEYEFPCLLVLGCFDGLHIGHAELLKKAKLQAKINGLDLGVMMFAEGKGGKQIYSFEERVALLEQYNVKFVLKIEFTNDFKNTKPLDFLNAIEDKLNVKAYMSGKDFRFGAGAKGKSSTLKNYGEDEENGVWYMSVKDVLSDGDKVSTTFIKSLLEDGNIARANELLGRNFSVCGAAEECGGAIKLAYPENKVKLQGGEYPVKCTAGENVYNGVAVIGEDILITLDGADADVASEQIKIEFLSAKNTVEVSSSAENETAQPGERPVPASVETVTEQVEEQPAEEPAVAPETAVEELAVADETNSEPTETADEPQSVEEVETVEEVSPVEETENAEVDPFAESSAEDADFEDELNEEFEETEEVVPEEITEEITEENTEFTTQEVTEEETAEQTVPEESDGGYTLTEIAEEPIEETETETPFEEEPAEEVQEENSEEIPDGGESD